MTTSATPPLSTADPDRPSDPGATLMLAFVLGAIILAVQAFGSMTLCPAGITVKTRMFFSHCRIRIARMAGHSSFWSCGKVRSATWEFLRAAATTLFRAPAGIAVPACGQIRRSAFESPT